VKKDVCRIRFVIFVFPRFHVWNPGFLFLESAFFFICLSRPQDCSDCDLELQTVSLAELPRHPGKFLQEWAGLPRMTSVNCSLVDTVLKPAQHATWQKNDTWHHLIGPRGIICHVSSSHWSVPFLMPVGVDTVSHVVDFDRTVHVN
jgi:hypothetical protein